MSLLKNESLNFLGTKSLCTKNIVVTFLFKKIIKNFPFLRPEKITSASIHNATIILKKILIKILINVYVFYNL